MGCGHGCGVIWGVVISGVVILGCCHVVIGKMGSLG